MLILGCIKKEIPLKRMYLEIYDHEFGSMRFIASADEADYTKLNILAPLSDEARVSANNSSLLESKSVFIFDDPKNKRVRFMGIPDRKPLELKRSNVTAR